MLGYILTGAICLLAAAAVLVLIFGRKDHCSGCNGKCEDCAKAKK